MEVIQKVVARDRKVTGRIQKLTKYQKTKYQSREKKVRIMCKNSLIFCLK